MHVLDNRHIGHLLTSTETSTQDKYYEIEVT